MVRRTADPARLKTTLPPRPAYILFYSQRTAESFPTSPECEHIRTKSAWIVDACSA